MNIVSGLLFSSRRKRQHRQPTMHRCAERYVPTVWRGIRKFLSFMFHHFITSFLFYTGLLSLGFPPFGSLPQATFIISVFRFQFFLKLTSSDFCIPLLKVLFFTLSWFLHFLVVFANALSRTTLKFPEFGFIRYCFLTSLYFFYFCLY